MRNEAFLSPYLVFLIVVILPNGNADCNHDEIMDNIFYVCNVYTENPTYKREAKDAWGFDKRELIMQPTETAPSIPVHQYPTDTDDVQQPKPSTNPFLKWLSNNNVRPKTQPSDPLIIQYPHRDYNFQTVEGSNQPENLESFDKWYLNPVYASEEWLSPLERWRRIGPSKQEAIDYILNVCCTTRCPFPEAYSKFDKKFNIC